MDVLVSLKKEQICSWRALEKLGSVIKTGKASAHVCWELPFQRKSRKAIIYKFQSSVLKKKRNRRNDQNINSDAQV